MPGNHPGVYDQISVDGREMKMSATFRAEKAVEMRLQGMTWAQVAERAGYANGPNARRAMVNHMRKTVTGDEVVMLRELEHERLNQVTRLALPGAVQDKDPKKMALLLRASELRAKLLGLNVNEARLAGAAEASAVADLAAASMLQANLISVLHEVGMPVDQIDRVIELLNERLGAVSEAEPEEDESVVIEGETG